MQDLRHEDVPRAHRHASLPVAARLRIHALAAAAPGVENAIDAGFANEQADHHFVAPIQSGRLAPEIAGETRGTDGARRQPGLGGKITGSDAIAQMHQRHRHGAARRQFQVDRAQAQDDAFAPPRMPRVARTGALAQFAEDRLVAALPFDGADGDLVDGQPGGFRDPALARFQTIGEVGVTAGRCRRRGGQQVGNCRLHLARGENEVAGGGHRQAGADREFRTADGDAQPMHHAPATGKVGQARARAVVILFEREGVGTQELAVEVMQAGQWARLLDEGDAVLDADLDGLAGDFVFAHD